MGKKTKNRKGNQPKKEEKAATLGDLLNQDTMAQLKEVKEKFNAEKELREQQEKAKRAEEKRQKEKNKTFEELLSESELDWKKYK
ncbi:YqkE family protein [Mesobacillus harenae]|uniref:YqkE family protein n=1 Tax=Mesobacillus harenae TaxID=2213203 RepID=UPI0015804349|nr:YqkE family protein [Mesobacillus harenae]